jgi:CRISPR-associated protein Csm4
MIRTFQAFKLALQGPLHLSRGRSHYETSQDLLHSDTLKSAMLVCALQLYPEDYQTEAATQSFLTSFRISSAYPYCGEEYFFPKPMARMPLDFGKVVEGEAKAAKTIKKIEYLGKSYFERVLQSESYAIDPAHLQVQKGKFLSDLLPKDALVLTNHTQQRVTIPPMGSGDSTIPFYLDRIYFGAEAGLFFLTDATDPALLARLKAILRLLGDHGIGTDRNIGNGHFNVEGPVAFDLSVPASANRQMALSLYCPAREELTQALLENSSYQLIRRGGYLASPGNEQHLTYRKRSVYMFAEGSVFPTAELLGKYVDLKPQADADAEALKHGAVSHPVWRDGQAIFVPFQPTDPSSYG